MQYSLIFSLSLALIAPTHVRAEEQLDSASAEALQKTIEMMNNPQLRDASLKDPNAKKADAAVGSIAGGNTQLKNDIYSLSSVLFAKIVKESAGDSTKMGQLLLEAQRNPASFADKYFPPGSSEAATLKKLAEQAQPAAPVHRSKP